MSATTDYERILSVERTLTDGNLVTLALQIRWSARLRVRWPTLSWRTRLRPGGPNRRFYISNGEPWTVNANTALAMLQEMQRLGGLDDRYLDPRQLDFTAAKDVASETSAEGRETAFEAITIPGESWGTDPFFVALEEHPNDHHEHRARWRKIVLVNRATAEATFRSTTTDEQYKPRKVLRPGSSWFLDNSMPDISVQPARLMLEALQTTLGD